MSHSTIQTDIFFAEFDGRPYAYGLSSDETRATAESSFRFGDPSDDYALGNSWAVSPDDSGWRIVRRTFPVTHLAVEFVGEIGVTNHVSWQCPECGAWSSEDVEHDAVGPLLVHCGSRHHADDGIWVILNW
ncbi:hypothetical protein [Stieleria varia]|uniref:Uncharacterized protein n=1 Tax=Stieleria varia TaxID=2528005 RepID=A0A5C6B5L4_9BACT|nr:hypothetical protein [Stieleria varia]TWU05784.1 hypothetical protein Pla52n_14990 [Stieleria varia]